MILTVDAYTMHQPSCCHPTPSNPLDPHLPDQSKPCIVPFAMPHGSSCNWMWDSLQLAGRLPTHHWWQWAATTDAVPNPAVYHLQLTPSNLCWLGKTWEGDTSKPPQRFSSAQQNPYWSDPCQWLPFQYGNSLSTCTHQIYAHTILCACTILSNSLHLLPTLHQQIYASTPY